MTTLENIPQAIAFLGYDEHCKAYKFVTPHHNCGLSYSFQHGPGGFSCGGGFSGVWAARRGLSTGDALTVAGTDRDVTLPDHSERRPHWLAPIDTEGFHKNYPVQMDDYIDFYPREFTLVGERRSLKNEGAVQVHHYITMKGEHRSAIAGTVSAECVEMYFIHWTSPELSAEAEGNMISFLEDLRLEGVRLGAEDSAEMCKRPS